MIQQTQLEDYTDGLIGVGLANIHAKKVRAIYVAERRSWRPLLGLVVLTWSPLIAWWLAEDAVRAIAAGMVATVGGGL